MGFRPMPVISQYQLDPKVWGCLRETRGFRKKPDPEIHRLGLTGIVFLVLVCGIVGSNYKHPFLSFIGKINMECFSYGRQLGSGYFYTRPNFPKESLVFPGGRGRGVMFRVCTSTIFPWKKYIPRQFSGSRPIQEEGCCMHNVAHTMHISFMLPCEVYIVPNLVPL